MEGSMAWSESITYWVRRSAPLLGIALLLGIAGALIVFVPARGAAALLGILVGAVLGYLLATRTRHTVRIAALWGAIAVAADAAYARLNDQASVTVANGLTKVVDAFVKLTDPLIRGLGMTAGDPRVKVAAVAPDFVWALILSLIFFTAFGFSFAARTRR
jgi:hypothetical protein